MRHALGAGLVVALLVTASAHAQPAASSGVERPLWLRCTQDGSVGWFTRTTSARSFEEGTVTSTPTRSRGAGLGLTVAAAHPVSPRFHIGLAFAYGRTAQELAVRGGERAEVHVGHLRFGPEVTLRPTDRVYARLDAGVGRFAASPQLPGYPVDAGRAYALGGALGVVHPLTPAVHVELGLATTLAWARDGEDGDFNRYEDRKRLASLAVSAALVFKPR